MTAPKIQVRGIRAAIPAGYVVGRIDPRTGAPQLISLKKLGGHLVQAGAVSGPGAVGTPSNPVYDFLGFSAQGPFTSLEQFDLSITPKAVKFPSVAAAGHDIAVAQFAPAADFTFILTDDLLAYLASGTNVVCSIKFLAGQKTGSFTWGATTIIPFGTVLWIVMPITPDAQFAAVQVLFPGDPQ